MPAARPCVHLTGPPAGSRLRPHELVAEPRDTRRERRLDAEQLVGSGEIAERLGLQRVQTVRLWQKSDPSFPQPVAVLGAGTGRRTYIWYGPEVRAWARAQGVAGDG